MTAGLRVDPTRRVVSVDETRDVWRDEGARFKLPHPQWAGMGDRYKALVEADCIIVPRQEFESAEEAEAYLEENVNTGHLGPVNVRGVEVDDSASESSSRTDSDGQRQEVDDAHSDSGGGG